ncbi:MAG TPA: peptidoglycan-binding protein [Pyrinomonadaceae bacterium]|nr:peptidoglycan-binding protein [Pyrinomonadaceae bacterium]
MPINYQVKQGDCISSIAYEHGFSPETLWNEPNNSELRTKRMDRNILFPGDVVFVPDKRIKEVREATDQVYKYKLKNTPEKLRLQLLKEGEPRRSEAYELEIDDLRFNGSTDGEGRIEHSVPPDSKSGKLKLRQGEEVYDLSIGHLDPLNEISGAQGRLRHLGYYFGPIDGADSAEFEHAVQLFQAAKGFEPSGDLDARTQDALHEGYGR